MEPPQQSAWDWAAPPSLIESPHMLLACVQKLIGAPLNEEERNTFGRMHEINEVYDHILNNRLYARMIDGDKGIGSMCESYIALQSGALWEAKEAWDVLTLWYEDGYKPRCFTSQVRHSKNYKSHQWNFRTIDNKKKRRYDMFVGVGYLPLPEDAEVEYMNSTYHHLHPKNTEVFLIPVEDITTASIQINKTRFHEQSGKQNKYWQYNIPLHSNIRKAMQRAAQGLPIHVSYQATLDFGV